MNISDVGKAADLSAKTIRYYEEIGLIQPLRSVNGYRNFTDSDVQKLQFLARARALGFSIDHCRSLLALWADHSRASSDVRRIAHDHLAEIENKIAALKSMQNTLTNLVESCAGDDRPDCPILLDLATQKKVKP